MNISEAEESVRQFLRQIFKEYRLHPILWHSRKGELAIFKTFIVKELTQNKKNEIIWEKKEEAKHALAKMYEDIIDVPGICVHVMNKLKTYISAVRAEHKGLKAENFTGEPTLWYYNDLLFVADETAAKEAVEDYNSKQSITNSTPGSSAKKVERQKDKSTKSAAKTPKGEKQLNEDPTSGTSTENEETPENGVEKSAKNTPIAKKQSITNSTPGSSAKKVERQKHKSTNSEAKTPKREKE